LSNIYANCSPIEVFSIHISNRSFSSIICLEGYKSKAFGSSSVSIRNNSYRRNGTKTAEFILQALFSGFPGQTSNKTLV